MKSRLQSEARSEDNIIVLINRNNDWLIRIIHLQKSITTALSLTKE